MLHNALKAVEKFYVKKISEALKQKWLNSFVMGPTIEEVHSLCTNAYIMTQSYLTDINVLIYLY